MGHIRGNLQWASHKKVYQSETQYVMEKDIKLSFVDNFRSIVSVNKKLQATKPNNTLK